MQKNDYSNLSKEELLKIVEKLESRKKYGLIWDEEKVKEQFEKDAENALPVLKEISSKEITDKDSSKPVNILIEGDNYHALSVLNFTHQGKIDVIYIDPPYNTGNKTWKYNNDYIEKEDSYRHSKWLSFMNKRLRLAKNLLKEDGFIVVTIDDYEVFTLGVLLDEIFGEQNRLGNVVVINKKSGRTTDKFFATSHEYYLFYAKNSEFAKVGNMAVSGDRAEEYTFEDNISKFKYRDFLRTGGYSTPEERPNSYYPIYFNERKNIISIEKISDSIEIWPIDSKGAKRVWRRTRPTLVEDVKKGDIIITKNGNGKFTVKIKERLKEESKPKTVWDNPQYDAASHGTKLLESILGESRAFDYPKSLYAVKDAIRLLLNDKESPVILDFFAGSGTTGHAVMELNKEDDGKRVFILCTNNENNICDEVTLERVKKVIRGYKNRSGEQITGLGGSLKYFKTKFVKKYSNGDDFKTRITNECTEMLCLREGVFDEIKKNNHYRIFQRGSKTLAVYYSLARTSLPDLKKILEKIEGEKTLYCFTLDPIGLSKSEFVGWHGVTLEPIPQKILDVYKQIYEY
ncbi:MAG: site-specific DNA-methyltransferase [Candidatus Doudnabacteria bacterium]|nr:site-specific DNA-methyltransferase [Candidatus Doudnabacteria bacterium]